MRTNRFPLILALVIPLLSIGFPDKGLTQSSSRPVISSDAYRAAIEAEISHSARDRYLFDHADAYSRLVGVRAMRRLGFDMTDPHAVVPEIENVDLSDSGVAKNITRNASDQNETTIAISRTNEKIIVAGANDTRMYFSGMAAYTTVDQGKNWKTYFLPQPPDVDFSAFQAYGDPAIAVDDSGFFYYAYLAGDASFQFDNLIVATSEDGKTWQNGSYIVPTEDIGGFEDKEHITVDKNPGSPFYGRIYVVWVHFEDATSNSGGARLAWSDDKGNTWSNIYSVTDHLIEFAEVKTAGAGEVILTFSTNDDGSGMGDHQIYISKDGGQSFSGSTIAKYSNYPINDFSRPGLKGYDGFRCFPYVAEDIDLSTNVIHLVYGSWNSDASDNGAASLYYVQSKNFGATWSVPKAVGIANPLHSSLAVDRFCPWVSVNQKTGDAFVVYYSSEDDSDNNQLTAVYRTRLTEAMTEYPHVIGDRIFDPTLIRQTNGAPPFIGDYIGSDAIDTVYAAAWTENRISASDGDIFAYVGTPKPSSNPISDVSRPVVLNSTQAWISPPSPNPVIGQTLHLSYYIPSASEVELAIYSNLGAKVLSLFTGKIDPGTYTKQFGLASLPSGRYIVRLSGDKFVTERSLVVTK
ncbi:MAG: T9SS type A sorting domain-containing protein [Bacteroidota bacterium]|nr:T9SS type A sorting domain-containing protein [Bacteroidota bacterium]